MICCISCKTTCHPAFHDKLPTFWAVKSKIQVSGELTTSRGAGTSLEFALSFVDQLFGESVAREIGQSLVQLGAFLYHLFLSIISIYMELVHNFLCPLRMLSFAFTSSWKLLLTIPEVQSSTKSNGLSTTPLV